jgi:hypothetical protein
MAVETLPAFEQDETYSAETLRHVFGTLLARGSAIGSIVGGLVGATDMQVTAGSGMQVLVATGEAWISGTSVSTQGGYLGRVTSSTALAISASSESNPRIDTIIAQIKDKAVAGGEDSFTVSVVTGTATSGATLANKLGAGSVPASSLVLAYVLVPAKAVSIVSGDIENVATRVEAPNAIVGENALKAEAVTDTKVVKGRALVNTENKLVETKPSAPECLAGFVPSTAHVAIVTVWQTGGAETNDIEVEGKVLTPTTGGQSHTFPVPAGARWKFLSEPTTGSPTVLTLLL